MTLPDLDEHNSAFWQGGAHGRLLIYRCTDCRRWVYPPVPYCAECGSRYVGPEAVSGLGTLYTYTVNAFPWVEADDWQRVIALVELDEQPGLRILTNLVGSPEPRCGDRLEVEFRPAGDVYLPVFHPAPAG